MRSLILYLWVLLPLTSPNSFLFTFPEQNHLNTFAFINSLFLNSPSVHLVNSLLFTCSISKQYENKCFPEFFIAEFSFFSLRQCAVIQFLIAKQYENKCFPGFFISEFSFFTSSIRFYSHFSISKQYENKCLH